MSTGGPKAIIFTSDKTPFTEKEKVVFSNLLKLELDTSNPSSQNKFNSNYERLSLMQQKRYSEFALKVGKAKLAKAQAAYDAALNQSSNELSNGLRLV